MDAFQYVFPRLALTGRAYHNVSHITRMIAEAHVYGDKTQIYKTSFEDDDNIEFELKRPLYEAILFHDVIYKVPTSGPLSNEEMSAGEYLNFAERQDDGRDLAEIESVLEMIRATEHHFDGAEYDDYLTNLILDLDLLSFTDPYDKFLETHKNIDAEFLTHYPRDLVIEKRKNFLLHIVDNYSLKYRVIDNSGVLTNIAYENINELLSNWKSIYK